MGGQGGWPTKSGGQEAEERARVTDEGQERYRLGDTQSAHRIGRTVRRICPPDRLSSRSDFLGVTGLDFSESQTGSADTVISGSLTQYDTCRQGKNMRRSGHYNYSGISTAT